MPSILTIDAETFYSREFSLTKLTTEAYVRSPLFETIGVSFKINDGPTTWFKGPDVAEAMTSLDWSDKLVLAQHCAFDAAILAWHYNVKPLAWLDTLGMSRALFPHEKSHSLAAQAKRMGIGTKGDEVLNALGKRYADFSPEELQRYGDYCMNDTELTYALFQRYMAMGFPKQELKLIDMTIRMFVEPVLELDAPLLRKHLTEVRCRKQELLEAVRDNMLQTADPDAVHAVFTDGLEGIKKLLMSNPKFAAELEQTRWGLLSLKASLWLLQRSWTAGRNARGDRQGAAELGKWLLHLLAEEAKALQLPRYLQQPEDLAEQSPRMERLLVWLHLARGVLELAEVDRLYGELAKLHELARQPLDEEAREFRVQQTQRVWTLKGWKQLLRH